MTSNSIPYTSGSTRGHETNHPSLLSVATLILWLGCAAIAIAGFSFSYARPQTPAKEPAPIQAEILHVELTTDPLPPLDAEPPPASAQPPPLLEPISAPQTPPMIAVAKPSPAIAFALPVEAPARIVEAKEASFAGPANTNAVPVVAGPTAQPLTFGQGEGRQPAPEYPRAAMRAGQEGTVTVRFNVGENGRVIFAEPSSASPWPLLNEAALRVVRERWRFRQGANRFYEVSIRFELKK